MVMGGDTFVDWRIKGKCASLSTEQYDKLFFPDEGRSINKAKRFCKSCPVIAQCLQEALKNNDEGIWAGTSRSERCEILKFREQLQRLPEHTQRKVVRRTNVVFV